MLCKLEMEWHQLEYYRSPHLLFHLRGTCPVDNKRLQILWELERPWLKVSALDTAHGQSLQAGINWEEKGSPNWQTLLTCGYRTTNNTDFKVITATGIWILRLSYLTQYPPVSKLIAWGNRIWKLSLPPFCHPLKKVVSLIQAELLFLIPTLSF